MEGKKGRKRKLKNPGRKINKKTQVIKNIK